MENPYISGSIIRKGDQFYNRQNLLTELTRSDSKAYYLRGNRRIGKTSLLQHIYRRLLPEDKLFPVYIDLEGLESIADLAEYFQYALNETSTKKGQKPVISDKNYDVFDMFKQWQDYSNNNNYYCYLILDEAEELLVLSDNDQAKLHRVLIKESDKLNVIVTATNRLQELFNRRKGRANFLENFIIKPIGGFSSHDAENLIRQVQNLEGEVNVDSATINNILKYAGTHPFLIQKLCFNLFENGSLRNIENKDLALDKQLRSIFDIDFSHLENDQQQVLHQFSWEQRLTISEFKGFSETSITSALVELEHLGFLKSENGQYTIGNYFLAQWLEEKKTSLTTKNPPMPKLNVFISYAHKDEAFKEALDTHLTMLKRSDKIATWNDRAILAGTEWDDEIKEQLEQANIIILLVSASFLASKYIWENELTLAMEWHKKKEVRIVPVFIKPCDWKDAPFGSVQGLPRDAKPVGDPDNDEAWVGVAKGIRDLVDDLLQNGFPVKKTTVRPVPISDGASTPSKPNNANQLEQILSLIDSDMLAAFDLMDKLDWGNQKGTYNDKKAEWIDPVVGFNKTQFRERLKILLKGILS